MAATMAQRGRLWRYNYAILTGAGYWIIVLPVAASQVVTLWMMALAGDFNETVAAQIAEMMTPIIGAFLVAHSLAPEYRSGVGAVLACKPVSLHRVVTMRVGLAMLAALALSTITLGVCNVGLKQFDMGHSILACLPSLWFLSMVALTFATMFRNALGGFAVAAALWGLDFAVGYGVQPFLSLQGLHAHLDNEPLALLWVQGKVALLVAGAVLLWVHGRLLRKISRPPEARDITRIAVTTALVLLAYCASGAATTVGYGYVNRAHLSNPDVVWLRRQLTLYGPVPVARFFGSAFETYISSPPPARAGQSSSSIHIRQLEQARQRWPHSMWADGIAFALATEREMVNPAAASEDYFYVETHFGGSPFAPKALARVIRSDPKKVNEQTRLRAARLLIATYPRTPEAEGGAGVIRDQYPGTVHAPELIRAALIGADAGPVYRRPTWLITAAMVEADAGQKEEAVRLARQTATEGAALLQRDRAEGNTGTLRVHVPEITHAMQQATELVKKLGGS